MLPDLSSVVPADPGVGAAVIPGLGVVNAGHVGATVGLLSGVVAHAPGQDQPADESTRQQIATRAHGDPARYGADLLLHGHNRKRYDELARGQRLPSQIWAQHESTGQLEGHLRTVHERSGEQLQQLYRHRPMGERALLGLAAASGTSEDVARALDALRFHPAYPARTSFSRLVDGFSSPEIARIAAAFLPGNGGSESAIEVYRTVREAREQTRRARRRELFLRLREQWAGERPALIPLFEGVTRGFSPAQTERLRLELERCGNAEAVFEEIENDNVRRRLNAVDAAFRRWLAEWEASHDSCAQTPLQEPHVVLESILRPRPIVVSRVAVKPPAVVDVDRTPDSERQIVLLRVLRYADAAAQRDEDSERCEAGDADAVDDEAGALRALRAPPPGAYAADGLLPWGHLTQGFGRRGEERLRRAWAGGRQWDAYQEILARRGEETIAARETEFLRCVTGLGCELPGPCRIEREQLAVLGPLGAGFTPEQWARLRTALTEGTLDPLEVWRTIERENVAEAVSVREPAFIRYVGAWGHTPRWNPVEWARTAPRLGRVLLDEEASGLLDEEGDDFECLDDDDRDVVSPEDQGISSLFGASAGDRGTMGALNGNLRGFAEQTLGALTGRSSQNRPAGSPTRSLDEAAGILDGTEGPLPGRVEEVLSTVDRSVGSLLAGSDVAPRPPSGSAVADRIGGFAEQAGLDLQRVLAPWGGPQSKLGEQTVRALTGIGLTELAATPPMDLLRIVAGHAPNGSDPSGWWGELTAGQGLSESAEQELRNAIDTNGPKGLNLTLATYVRLLQDATDAQKVLRDAIFTTIHEAAQRVAGPMFDPARLLGGDPFVLLSEHVGDWTRVAEAMKSGTGVLEAFRQTEDARQERLIRVDAPAWMGRMLAALWVQRQKASGVLGSSGGGAEEAGAVDHALSGHPGVTPSDHLGNTPSSQLGGPSTGRQGSPPSGHGASPAPGQAAHVPSVHPTYTMLDRPEYTLLRPTGTTPPGHAGNPPSGHQGNAPPAPHVYAPPGLPGNPPSGHQGNAPPAPHVYAPPGLPGNPPSGHQGNAPPAPHVYAPPGLPGNLPSGHQGNAPPQHPWSPPPAHRVYSPPGFPPSPQPVPPSFSPPQLPGSAPPAHRPFHPPPLPGNWPPAPAGNGPPSHAGNGQPSHAGNGQPSQGGAWDYGHPSSLPWNGQGNGLPGHNVTWAHRQEPLPWNHDHGIWEPGYQGYRPWGHQRTWESARGYWQQPPGYQVESNHGNPGYTPWGHQRTWGSARDYWRNHYGYVGGYEHGRDFWRYAPGHPHRHMPVGAAILSAVLPFPFNLLLGHRRPREEARREPVHAFWRRSPDECPYDPFRAIWQRASGVEGARQVVSELQRRFQPPPVREVVVREAPVREVVVREAPVREIVVREAPVREIVWCDPPVREIVRAPAPVIIREPAREVVVDVDVDVRPRPLYHLSFGRPMSERELRRYLTVAPQLCAHPDGVLAEMAGLLGQARDVRGVDATTGEYLLLPGETLADIAYKLVGDRRRWREIEAANPLRAEGDPRLRIPPSWFGYVPYSIPVDSVRELREASREGEATEIVEIAEADADDAQGAGDDAGYVRGRYARRGGQGRRYWPYAPVQSFGSFAGPQTYRVSDPNDGDPYGNSPVAEDASGPRAVETPRRRYRVTHFDALGTPSPTYTRETAEQIVMQHKLFDGQRVLRPEWWAELRDVNPQKPLTPDGWWRDIREGEFIWIPDFWPMAKPEPGPGSTDAGSVWDSLAQLNPFGAGAPMGNGAAPTLDDPAAAPMILPETTVSGTVANTGPRQALARHTYTVVRGDWPQKIAQKLGAQGRPRWLSEFQRANPHKPVKRESGNWFNLYAGEVINIPDAWSAGSTDAAGDDDAGLDAAWMSLTEVQARAPYVTPLATYFRGTQDADGAWVHYATTLAPYFEGVVPGDSLEAVLDASCSGFYMAVPGTSGPVGWRKATANELRRFPEDIVRQVQVGGITFWVDPTYGVSPTPSTSPANPVDLPLGNMGPRPTVTRQTYTVVRGDWPQKIARRFGAQGRVRWLNELQRANPHKLTNRTTGNWSHLDVNEVVNIPDAWVSTDTGAEEDSDAGALRQNLTLRTYAVVAGDGMQRIAQKLGAGSTGNWFGELRDANPHKKMAVNAKGKQVAWESLYPGEIINIPDTWPYTPLLRPAPGGVPTHAPYPGLSQFPAFPGGAVPSPTAPPGTVPAAATVDPGTMLRVQAILIAFRQVHPEAIEPKDFGTGMPFSPDATGVLTPRTQQALASFQRWSNAMAGSRLRSDGILDPDTIAALDSFSAQAIGGLAQRPPVVPIGGAGPASGERNPLGGLLGAAAASAGDLARRVAPPAAPPAGGEAPDPFAGLFGAAGDFLHNVGREAPPISSPAPRRPRVDPERAPWPTAPVLGDLPGALEQYGIPGVPGLPGGAPHAPRPRPLRVEAPPTPAPDFPPDAPAPVAKPASSDGSVVPLVLTGLGILAGVLV
jgi:hypothetical protein